MVTALKPTRQVWYKSEGGGSRTPCSMEASQSGYESSDGIGPPMTPDLVYINGYLFKKTRTGKWQKR